MQQLKIEKRIAEQLEGIRKMAALLPSGKANALLNKCNKIAITARKAQAIVDAPTGSLFPAPVQLPMEPTQEDIAARYNSKEEVFRAMLAGRKISLEDAREFRTSQIHTIMTYIRRDIDNKRLPYHLAHEEVRPDPKRRSFFRYYLTPREGGTDE